MAGGPPALPREIRELSFFYENFRSTDEAASYVIRNNRGPGTFLLRPSSRNHSALTLTISIDDSMARHVNVHFKAEEKSPTGFIFFIIEQRPFNSFHELYEFYSLHNICNLEMVSNVRLLNPIERTSASRISRSPSDPPPSFMNFPIQGPMVTSDEIPPIPRKSSVTSWGGSPTEPGQIERERSRSQPGFPELPSPLCSGADLDSTGNDLVFSSSSGSGSDRGATGGRPVSEQHRRPSDIPGSPGIADGACSVSMTYSLPGSPPTQQPPLNKKELKKLEKQEKKFAKEMAKKEKKISLRPPAPIPPEVGDFVDEPPYYSTPKPHKNKIEDLKQMLRESEMCDCGLRMMDAQLAMGWTVHRSRDTGTCGRVFYQHDDGNTTWQFPEAITHELTDAQVHFIVTLCQKGNHDIPRCLERRCMPMARPGRGSSTSLNSSEPGRGYATQLSSSQNSNRSRSNSSSSEQFGGSSQSLNHGSLNRPLPKPGEGKRE